MLVKVGVIADGHGPSEKLIGIKTSDGEIEQVIVSKRVLKNDDANDGADRGAIEVGLALSRDGDNVLVELPRESTRGRWRIWIPQSEVFSFQAAE